MSILSELQQAEMAVEEAIRQGFPIGIIEKLQAEEGRVRERQERHEAAQVAYVVRTLVGFGLRRRLPGPAHD